MASDLGVNYTILGDSGIIESQEPGEPTARVRFRVLASDRATFLRNCLGASARAGSSILRAFPYQYPPSPNLIALACENIEYHGPATPVPGAPSQWVWRKWAYITIRFGLAKFSIDGSNDASGQPYTTTTFKVSGEFLTLPDSTYTFPSGKKTDVPVGILMPQIEISIKRWMMPYEPVAEMAAIAGCVNNATFAIGDFIAPVGTLLFPGGDTEITCDTLGVRLVNCTYVFLYRPQPWNYFLSPKPTEGWAEVLDGSGNPPYPPGDFATLP